jgi:hypothetical protein
MFTATMPASVERLAKKYMRAPAIVRIGDQDSGKNRRIAQEIIFLPSEARKKAKLIEVLHRAERYAREREGAKRRGAAFSALLAAHEARLAELDLFVQAAAQEERDVAAWLEAGRDTSVVAVSTAPAFKPPVLLPEPEPAWLAGVREGGASSPLVAAVRAGLADLLTTFKAKAAAERPARWPSMEVVWTDADATAAGGVTRFEAFCNPNGAASPFDAKVLITAKAGGGVSVATECPLAGLRADVDSCEA